MSNLLPSHPSSHHHHHHHHDHSHTQPISKGETTKSTQGLSKSQKKRAKLKAKLQKKEHITKESYYGSNEKEDEFEIGNGTGHVKQSMHDQITAKNGEAIIGMDMVEASGKAIALDTHTGSYLGSVQRECST